MCNPRRVRAKASRRLAEAWEHEIRRISTLSDTAVGETRVRERLDDSIGGMALTALETALAGRDDWDLVDGAYRHQLDGGYVAYHLDSQELELVARLEAEIEATAETTQTLSGEVDETIEAEGEGMYYDDEWGGRTKAKAEKEAARKAEAEAERQAAERVAELQADAEASVADELEAAAEAEAAARLEQLRLEQSEELRRQSAERSTAVGIQGRNAFHQVLAVAYRDAILAYAGSRNAENVLCVEEDGTVRIEFELST